MANIDEVTKISLVTPSFNQGKFIERTVRSVLAQRIPNLEYIVMDGGSTDETLERIQPYLSSIAHFQSAPDGGQSAAIAEGFLRSTGNIMGYLNSDDVLLPGALNYVSHFFETHPNVDLIYGHRCIINESDRVLGHWILPPHSNTMMRRWDLIPQETCFWRRGIFERKGNVDPKYKFAMDYDLFVRYMNGGRCMRVNRFLAAFRVHEASKTSSQLQSVGKAEIGEIRSRYRLWSPELLGSIFSLYVQLRSANWLKRNKWIPGLPPGSGYSLDDVWGSNLV